MLKEDLQKLVDKNISIRKIAKELKCSYGTVKYWLNKYELKTNPVNYTDIKYCKRCDSHLPVDEFYKRKNSNKLLTYCKICTTEQTIERQRAFKIKCLEYKGGNCVLCGYNRCYASLEFHHIEPEHKDFTIAHRRLWKFDNNAKIELDKCALVCSNCHREIHSGFVVSPGIEPGIEA